MDIQDAVRIRKEDLEELLNKRRKLNNKYLDECPSCHSFLKKDAIRKNHYMCPECGHYFAMPPAVRIELIGDRNSFKPYNVQLFSKDPLDFPGYDAKLEDARNRTGNSDAVVTGIVRINGVKTAIAVLDSRFLMGSMGSVVGEQITRLIEYATKKHRPLIIVSASGGARMQEGLFSLMQMAKTAAAVERYKESGGLFISLLTNPTTGGVSASFATLGDIIIAEPGALIGFAGPRVIQQTIGERLPEGFQTAEFLLSHGMLDAVVERQDLKDWIGKIIRIHQDNFND